MSKVKTNAMRILDSNKIEYKILSYETKKGEHIEQKQTIGTAGKNIYNKDLGNHVHIVTQVNGKLVDPETIYDKTLEELK